MSDEMRLRDEKFKEFWHSWKGTAKENDEHFKNEIYSSWCHAWSRAFASQINDAKEYFLAKDDCYYWTPEARQKYLDRIAELEAEVKRMEKEESRLISSLKTVRYGIVGHFGNADLLREIDQALRGSDNDDN